MSGREDAGPGRVELRPPGRTAVLAGLTPDEALHLFNVLPDYLAHVAKWPQLTESIDEDGVSVWRCPRCGVEGHPENIVYAVDLAERWTSPSDYMDGELHFYYDSDGDYEGLFYICQNCCDPVSLPDNVREVAV